MSGHLEVITGPMYAGKSSELLRRLRRAEIAKKNVIAFKPNLDTRYSSIEIISHDKNSFAATRVRDAMFLERQVGYWQEVIGIDEVQFLDNEILNVIKRFIETGRIVIVTGLDMDFRKEPFGVMPELLSIAKEVLKLSAICQKCGEDAMYTQRLVDGKPAPLSGETVIVGGQEQYEARCENCWEAE